MEGPVIRPRRLRRTRALRDLVAETDLAARQLVLPVFVREGATEPVPIGSMPGVVQHTRDSLRKAAAEAADLGLGGIMLFGVPASKDAVGSGACAPDGILNVALRDVSAEVGDALPVMADLCLDEFTDHGHCGVLAADGSVDNDATLEVYARMAVAQAQSGADVVGPSGMMDGQVAVIRAALDAAGFSDVAILAYSAKYASAFYGPFREAVDSSLEGDRRTYQQDGRNRREGLREALLDVAEGADLVMVKPALPYLDVLREVRDAVDVPVAAYNISGEYAMVEAAAARGWIDREAAIRETLTSTPSTPSTSPSALRSQELFARAHAVTPGGVNSPVRAFNAVGGAPRFIASASGPYLVDVDGNEYVDLICSWGPMLLGHAHPEVLAAVTAAAARGTSYGTPTEAEVALAEEIVGRTPVDTVRLVSSGTEATMSAIRLARGFTGRDLVVKFAGCYHGHVDSLLASAGSGLATFAVPGTPGVPSDFTRHTLVLPYNDEDAVKAAFAEHGDRIACLITEAAAGNMGLVPPRPGFNRFLAETCAAHGALFVSDEVMTGFRVTREGRWGLDGKVEGWRPDLMTFGKVMGGGFPAAAFGGRADVMAHLAPEGSVYQAGTLSGNPVAATAGLTTLRLATDEVYAHLGRAAAVVKEAASTALTEAGVPHVVQSDGTMFSVFFPESGDVTEVRDFDGAARQRTDRFGAFFHAMLERGVHLPPSAFEAWFVSAAHDDAALDRVVAALPAAAAAAAAVPDPA